MNLINFHTYPKNAKYIKEMNVYYNSQGLVASYWVWVTGNGHNKYIIKGKIGENNVELIIEEQHITDWQIRYFHEEADKAEYDSLEFNGIGQFTGSYKYVRLCSWDCDDYTHLYIDDIGGQRIAIEILDITIENHSPDKPFIITYNEINYCDIIKPRHKLIEDALNGNPLLVNMKKIPYNKLFDNDYLNKDLYFIIDDSDQIIKFNMIKINKSKDDEDVAIVEATVTYEFTKYHVNNIELEYYQCMNDIGNESDTFVTMIINGKELSVFCYIAIV